MDEHSNSGTKTTEGGWSESTSTFANAAIGRGKMLAIKMENLARRAPLRFSLLIAAGLFALVFATLSPSYQSNDDLQLTMIASGKGACLAPDEHLIFTNVVIGHLLKSLYLTCPAIPWYGVYLYAAQYMAQVAILYCAIAPGYTRLRLGLYLLFFATVGLFLLSNLQFTTTAALAGQSGALLCLVALRRRVAESGRRAWPILGCGVAMLVLGSLIRLDCFYLTLLLILPAVICTLGWPPRWAVLWTAVGTGAICLALVLGLAAYNDAYYAHDPEWQHFFSYNKLRVKFNDYGWTSYTPQTAPLFEQVNWSENDHAMIKNWFFDDPAVYSEARLRQVLEGYPWRNERLTAKYCWDCARTICFDRSMWGVMLVLPLFLFCAARSRNHLMAYLGTAGLAITLLISIALFKVPPSRVYFPLLTFPFTLLLVLVGDSVPRPRLHAMAARGVVAIGRWRRRVSFQPAVIHVLALGGVLYGMGHCYRSNDRMQHVRQDFFHTLEKYLNWQDDQLYVIWPSGFHYELISPFDNLSSFSNFHHLVIGWPQRTPIYEAMKRRFNIQDVTRALYDRPDVFAVGYGGCFRNCKKFIREHYGVDVDFVWKYGDEAPSDFVAQFERHTRSDNASTVGRAASQSIRR